jgi:HAD superfamily hydrolase (TIGR01459 family)
MPPVPARRFLPMASPPPPLPPRIAGLGALARDYDGYLVDLWGVLHDGVRPYAGALDCLAELRRLGKRVLVLSNAPRRAAAVKAGTARIGIAETLYDELVCSGEETWRELAAWNDPFYRGLGRRCYPLMAARDRGILEGLRLELVEEIARADFLLATGVEGPADRVEQFADALDAARARDLPMICANPDLVVLRGGVREICAGSIAEAYERRGGRVRYHGKPHGAIYARCFELLAPIGRDRILAIGDSMRTDVVGAVRAGLAALFVLDGIHGEELAAGGPETGRLAALFDRWQCRPTAIMRRLAF